MANDPLRDDADGLSEELVAWRRRIHQNPELGFEERETSRLVVETLERLGVEVRKMAGTGVAGILRARGAEGPAVMLRADMDALPVQEVEGREYGSRVPGKMHACGHDGHTAMLLGAATLLSNRVDQLRHARCRVAVTELLLELGEVHRGILARCVGPGRCAQ